jgi:cytochrome c biogenesis protein CcmG/thiol:disulfide interchange protein DsbE
MRSLFPLGIFFLLLALLAYGLTRDPKLVPSPLIGKSAPSFNLPKLYDQSQNFAPEQLRGKVWVLNVWASWCVACRVEHPVITRLSSMKLLDIIGLNYKDEPVDGQHWLEQFGNPYALSVIDYDGRVGIDWGVYGVPETFVVGKDGLIKYKYIGPVTDQVLDDEIVPLVKSLI